jgi:hypothetical protein
MKLPSSMSDTQEANLIPAPDCDALQGLSQIAAWRGLTIGQVREQIAADLIPVHKRPGKNTVYAFKSEIIARMKAVLKPRKTQPIANAPAE